MTIDEYKQLLKNLKDAQGELTSAVCNDLQRLAGAEAESTKNKVREAYARGADEMWKAVKAMREMDTDERDVYFTKFVPPDTEDIWALDGISVLMLYENYVAEKKVEAEKREIHVGDEVVIHGKVGVILADVDGDSECVPLFTANESILMIDASQCKKTGRNYRDAKIIAEAIKNLKRAMK